MPRVRFKEAQAVPKTVSIPQSQVELAQLLHARAFWVENSEGADPLVQRVQQNLKLFGGKIEPQARWVIGKTMPVNRIGIGLGAESSLLGPHSLGFVNNLEGIAPWSGFIKNRPPVGNVAVVVPHGDALPEIVPLLSRRQLGTSWIISVGEGDPEAVLQFLNRDPATTVILLALGQGACAATLRSGLAGKPVALLETTVPETQRTLCRAVAHKAGAAIAESVGEWLAFGEVWTKPVSRQAPQAASAVIVVGAGYDQVALQAKQAHLLPPLKLQVGEESSSDVWQQYGTKASRLVICADADQPLPSLPPYALRIDPAQVEQMQALFRALSFDPPTEAEAQPGGKPAETELLSNWVRDLPPPMYKGRRPIDRETLSDHDAKRLFHAYGVRVSRQAPAATTHAALRVAEKLSFPMTLLDPEGAHEITCDSLAALKRQVPLVLNRHPYVMMREWIQPSPRMEWIVQAVPGLGLVLRANREAALLPLSEGESKRLGALLASVGNGKSTALAGFLEQLSSCVVAHQLLGRLTVYLGDNPVVVSADVTISRQTLVVAAS